MIARAGLVRLLSGVNQDLPPQDQQAYKALSVTPRWIQTALDESRGMTEGGAQARAVTTLGDLPLIVLSRGKDLDADSAASQARYLQLSTDSEQLFADHSGHNIHWEQPEAAVAAIVQMVAQVHVAPADGGIADGLEGHGSQSRIGRCVRQGGRAPIGAPCGARARPTG